MSDFAKQERLRQKRLRGYRIKSGLEELNELDAPKPKRNAPEPATASQPSDSEAESECGKEMQLSVFGTNWDEWSRVKSVLFSSSAMPATKRRALSTVAVWRARQRPQRPLPAYVEATELLVSAVCLDEEDALADVALAQSYGGTISRIVHVMTGSSAADVDNTYRKRAKAMGFPEEAVEVRQRVAHGMFPSISELRWVASMLLQHLFEHFWKVQANEVRLMEKDKKRKPKRSVTKAVAEKVVPSNSVQDIKNLLATLGSDDSDDGNGDDDRQDGTKESQNAKGGVEGTSYVNQMPTVVAGWKLE